MTARKNNSQGRKPATVIRPLDPSDPRSLDHPSYKGQWLELAGAIGRSMARADWDRQHAKGGGGKVAPAALYARFSSDLQEDRSIDDQLSLCQILAKREKLRVVATFNDRARSGATLFIAMASAN